MSIKKYWWVYLIAIIFLASFIIFIKLKNDSEVFEPKKSEEIKSRDISEIEKNEICPPVFSYEFTDFSKIDDFQPIGSISGASRGRSYVTIKKGESVPVYVPADAILVAVIYAYRGPQADYGEYGFKFDAGCGVTFLLDHLDSASEEMKKYAPTQPSKSTATNDSLSIPIKGGTLLGYTDGTPQARTFDFLVLDKNKKYSYININRWQWEQSLFSVCPYDLYEKNLREKYYQKIRLKTETKFIQSENCGNVSYDIADTISGGWFLDDTATDLNGEFMLIGERMNVVDLTIKTDSEGTKMRITDYNPKILPKDVGIGETVCYQGYANDWAYLHLIDKKTIEISNGQGTCPTSFPSSGAKKYYR